MLKRWRLILDFADRNYEMRLKRFNQRIAYSGSNGSESS